jgi:hypothetical protein
MGETTDQIAAHIENTRADLGANLQELEGKVKAATDWRQYFQKNPMTLIGVAFGGGVFLARLAGGHRTNRLAGLSSRTSEGVPRMQRAAGNPQTQQVLDTLDHIKGALIGVAAERFKGFIGDIVPGFQEQFEKVTRDQPEAPNNMPLSRIPR